MDREEFRAIRERRGFTGTEMAAWLNQVAGRRYDKGVISKWESGKVKVPREIEGVLLMAELASAPSEPPRRAVAVALALQKGGVAKTSTSVCLAYVLARAGRRVLLVDADSQGNATTHVGIPKDEVLRRTNARLTHADALVGRAPLKDVIIPTSVPNLDLVPASISLAATEKDLKADDLSPAGFMRDMLEQVRGDYDVIVIDSPPALGVMTMNALTAADFVLVPCETEAFAILGLEHLYDTITNVQRRANPGLKILGIVPTKYDSRLSQDRASLDDLQQVWGPRVQVFEPVPNSTIYSQCAAANRITLDVDPGAPGLETYVEVARRIIQVADAKRETAHVA